MDSNSILTNPLVIGGVISIAAVISISVILKQLKKREKQQFLEFFQQINQGDFTNFERGKKLIQKYPNFPQQEPINVEYETCLMTACKYGKEQIAVQLLEIGSGIRHLNKNNCNLLHLCCWDDNHRCLEEILNFIKSKNLQKDLEELLVEKSKGGWTALHIAAAKNAHRCFKLLISLYPSLPLPLNEQDDQGHTIFMMAAANGFKEIFDELIKIEEIDIHKSNAKGKSSLFFASINGNLPFVEAIVDRALNEKDLKGKVLYCADISGNSPLHAASIGGHLKVVEYLISKGLTLQEKSKSGDSLFHICVVRGTDDHLAILQSLCSFDEPNDQFNQINPNNNNINQKNKPIKSTDELYKMLLQTTSFGSTPLHDAALNLNHRAIDILLSPLSPNQRSDILNSKDNDGLTTLHSLCRAVHLTKKKFSGDDKEEDEEKEFQRRSDNILLTIDRLIEFGADVNSVDFANANSLHLLCYSPSSPLCLIALQRLLHYNINPFVIDSFGWTPLHALYQTSNHFPDAPKMIDLLTLYMKNSNPDFFLDFDPMKKRDLSNQDHLALVGPHSRIPIETRKALLAGDVSINGIANYILQKQKALEANGQQMKIVVMCGAGISVNCGIPDFRSRDGLYSKEGNADLFTTKTLIESPALFFGFLKNNFLPLVSGSIYPSLTHCFFKLLHQKQLLQRIYTQNIDMLEEKAGIDEELLVTAHGTFKTAHCVNCNHSIAPSDMSSLFWEVIRADQIPTCPLCSSLLRPDVVFFGEPLHPRFTSLHYKDLSDCDLLIVLGTSLQVYPFASLLSIAPLLTPRLLINRELTGPFTKSHLPTNYRDAAFVGDCDEGVIALAESLGWKDDLLALFSSLRS